MEQKIEELSAEDAERVEKQRGWVRDHYTPESVHKYETLDGKLRLLEIILKNKWIEPTETWKLQSLGITFGDALVQKMGVTWVAVEDEYGRDPALRDPGSSVVMFPSTTISKRVERGETVDVRDLFERFCQSITHVRSEAAG